ncbi:type II toxin-antitoxin system PemK/MazF family toxin [Rhizobium terrae]|uniref:type II toxin-antitoxin system PemK/MazF family toxin n=1 Tax=Rhizobium terrae TaxID=2171756 RepID=UPI0019680A49|nr:type II toxin-antitoxin system PemK/MazF family toxin [Rhizobium terrae]
MKGMLQEPTPGLVIRYAYLWRDDAVRGLEEGKDRPCAVVLAVKTEAGRSRVYIAPITHSPPNDPKYAIEVPPETKRRLGLDQQRSWVKTDDLNVFTWPGPDVRPIGRGRGFIYGFLPKNMTEDIIANVRERAREGQARVVNRDDAMPSED